MHAIRYFLDLITEAEQTGDLYHGTSIVNAAAIVADQSLIADDSHDDELGISFTRSERLGWDFAKIAEKRALQFDYDKHPEGSPSLRGALLVFDGDAMRTALGKALAPYVWRQGDGIDDEEEERFHGDNVYVEKFLKAVIVSPADIDWWAQAIPHLSNTYRPQFAKTVLALTRNPLFRPT